MTPLTRKRLILKPSFIIQLGGNGNVWIWKKEKGG